MQGPGKDQIRQWDETYVHKEYFGADPSELGKRALALFQQRGVRKVLELGCGQGRDTWLFLGAGLEVVALDYSDTGICYMRDKAREKGLEKGIVLQVQDARKGIPLENDSVDAVYSHMFFTMEMTEEEIAHILGECRRLLRPGGVNIYSVRNDHDPHYRKFESVGGDMYRNPMGFVVHFFTEEKVKRLATGYRLLWIKEFGECSPQYERKLYEVALEKP